MRKLTIAVDVDEVCADLLGAWLDQYNLRYQTSFLPEDITGWDLAETVRPSSRDKLYDILKSPYLYDRVYPILGARKAVRTLRSEGHRVVFVTTCVPGTEQSKIAWLRRHRFLENGDCRDFVAVTDKSLIRADILFDDKPDNVERFPGVGVLVRCPHNREFEFSRTIGSLAEAPLWVSTMYRRAISGGSNA